MADETIAPSGPRKSWDRRKDESKRAWTAFQLFRDSTTRRLAEVAAGLTPKCSVPNVARWSARYSWQARAADYDIWVDEQDRAEIARNRVSGRKRRLAIAHALEGLSAHAIKEWQDRLRMGLPLGLTLEAAALLGKAAAALEDSALGPERENARFTKIEVVISGYPDEESYEAALRGDPAPARSSDDAGATMSLQEFQRRQYEALSDADKEAQDGWRNPPKLTN